MGHLSNPIGLRIGLNRFSSFFWSSSKNYLLVKQDLLVFKFLNFFFKSFFLKKKKFKIIFFNFKILRFFSNIFLSIYVYNFHLFYFLMNSINFLRNFKVFRKYYKFYYLPMVSFLSYYFIYKIRFFFFKRYNCFFRFFLFSQKKKKKNFFFKKSDLKFFSIDKFKLFSFYYFSFLKFLKKIYIKKFKKNFFLKQKWKNIKKKRFKGSLLIFKQGEKFFFNIFKVFFRNKKNFQLKLKKQFKVFMKIFYFFIVKKIIFFVEKIFWGSIKNLLIFNLIKLCSHSKIFINFFFLDPEYLDSNFLIQFLIIRLRQGISFQSLFFKINNMLFKFLSKNRLLGFKIALKGRFTRRQRASFFWKRVGRVSLNDKLSFIDFSSDSIILKYGLCSLKLWLHFSQFFFKKKFFFIL